MKKAIMAVLLVIIMALSVFVIAPKASKPEAYQKTIESLNKKQTNILEMTGAATAASLALGAVPGDATTPIANKVIDMASYFIIILSVIILEKYFLTIAGYLTFTWLIPIACVLLGLNLFLEKRQIRHLALRAIALGMAIILIVPVSVKLTAIIEKTNEASINSTMASVKEIQEDAEAATEEAAKAEAAGEEEKQMEEENISGPFALISNWKEKLNEAVENTEKTIKEKASSVAQLSEEVIEKAKDTMNDFIEVVVIMLVTTCGIPILTVMFLFWIIKSLLGMEMDWSGQKERLAFMKKANEE